jgi:hypothetical protein
MGCKMIQVQYKRGEKLHQRKHRRLRRMVYTCLPLFEQMEAEKKRKFTEESSEVVCVYSYIFVYMCIS